MPLYRLIYDVNDGLEETTNIKRRQDATVLKFEMQKQRTPNWCWAATVASLEDYVNWTTKNGNKRSGLSEDQKKCTSQCVIAARDLDFKTACCETIIVDGKEDSKVTTEWDVQNALSAPLNQAKLHERTVRGKPDWDEVLESIAKRFMPVCCRVVWDDELRGAHFVVISAVGATTEDIRIDDSLYGTTVVPFDAFLRVYQPNEKRGGGAKRGRISHTYYLRRPQ